jgi:chromate transporter
VRLRDAIRVWAVIGLISFGGPAGQIAMMHKELVAKRRWIDEARFLHALNYCMLLPGPEAQQLAIYIGWLMHRTVGGVIAGVLFIAPGAIAMLGLSIMYVTLHQVPMVAAVFFGLRAAVLALVVSAVVRIARRSLKSRLHQCVAFIAFASLFLFALPFPIIVIAAGVTGWIASRWKSVSMPLHQAASTDINTAAPTIVERMAQHGMLDHCTPSLPTMLRTSLLCLLLWAVPVALIAALFGQGSIFFQQATFFSKTAVVTFGGAYAVLSYVGQRAVGFGWLLPQEMMTGLGLAESTPGPLILVLQFVGFVGGYHHPHGMSPLLAGALCSVITLWVTFVPCFLWILVGAPYVERIRKHRGLQAAMACTSAAVVGVVANLAIMFALTSLFATVTTVRMGPLILHVPAISSIDFHALALAAAASVAMVRFKVHVIWTLLASIAVSVAVHAMA